ncbi:TIGR02588 family protein [Ensifer soli]|uniref:TIGR02588 family protein n=1 Tax=Ciceribacter sp. sgz301302 TaxID=3342379 RepID=UPI0035B9CD44
MTRSNGKTHAESNDPHWIEWLTGLVSAVVVLAMLGWIAHAALTESDEAPDLHIAILDALPRSGGYQVRFSVTNTASVTAAAVRIRGEISAPDRLIDSAEVTLDYVPAASTASGALIFRTDPSGKRLEIRATGYADP